MTEAGCGHSGGERVAVRLALAAVAASAGNGVLGQAFGLIPLRVAARWSVLPSVLLLGAIMVAGVPGLRGRADALRVLLRRGAAWGLAATLAYDVVRPPMRRSLGFEYDPFRAVALFGELITGRAAHDPLALTVGWAYHYVDGIGFGVVFALLCPRGGITAGLAWAAVLQALLLVSYPPLVGVPLGDPGFLVMGFVGHAVFGVVLGAGVRRAAESRPRLSTAARARTSRTRAT